MKNLKPLEIADRLKELTSIDIFENTRTQEVVKVRSLFCYLLREKLAMRWTAISQFFQHNNKPMNHATVIHSIKNYHSYKLSDKKIATLEEMFTFDSDLTIDEINKIKYLENKIKRLETQIKDVGSDNSLYTKLKNIPAEKEEYIMNKIDLWLKEFEWKSKLNQV
tara:strand:- start:1637 stop:2131 length:495 start_codon:yes stop_codon:yes gene_type:complete